VGKVDFDDDVEEDSKMGKLQAEHFELSHGTLVLRQSRNLQEVREVSGPQRTVHGRKATAFIPKKAATPNVLTLGSKPWQVHPFPSTPCHDFC